MTSGSRASYQSALPPEARAGGERDDDDGGRLLCLPATARTTAPTVADYRRARAALTTETPT